MPLTIRDATPDDRQALPGLRGITEPIRVAVGPDGPLVALWLDPDGPPTAPGEPRLCVCPEPPLGPVQLDALEALIADAGETAAPGIRLGWDTMDATGLRRLERLGFRPTGAMPYFELGPGVVEHVSGYRDPTGSRVDLLRTTPVQ